MDETNNTAASAKKNNMMPVIVAVVLLLLVGAGIFMFASNKQQPATTTQPENAMTEQPSNTTEESTTEQPTGVDTTVTEEAGTTKTFSVEASSFAFSPKEMRVKKGDTVTVTVTNSGGMHDWVLDEFNVKTKQLASGQSETVEFVADQVGTFEYYCSVGNHKQMGMVGNLIVEE